MNKTQETQLAEKNSNRDRVPFNTVDQAHGGIWKIQGALNNCGA